MAQQSLVDQGLIIIEVSRSHSHTHTQTHTHTHSSRWNSSGRVIRPTERTLLYSTKHSQETDYHSFCEIRTHNPSKRAAADLALDCAATWIDAFRPTASTFSSLQTQFDYVFITLYIYSLRSPKAPFKIVAVSCDYNTKIAHCKPKINKRFLNQLLKLKYSAYGTCK